jgi:hypothetical protein
VTSVQLLLVIGSVVLVLGVLAIVIARVDDIMASPLAIGVASSVAVMAGVLAGDTRPVPMGALNGDHVDRALFALLGGLAAGIGITFLVVARLVDFTGPGAEALEVQRRRVLRGFVFATAIVGVGASAAGVLLAGSGGEDRVAHPDWVAACAAAVLTPLIMTGALLVVLAGQPRVEALKQGWTPSRAGTLQTARRRVRAVSWIGGGLVGAAIAAIPAIAAGWTAARLWLVAAGATWLTAYERSRRGDQRAAARVGASRSPLTSVVWLLAGAMVITGVTAVGDPLGDAERASDVYGLMAGVIGAALVVFAAGDPVGELRAVTRAEASRWEAIAIFGAVGLMTALAGAAHFAGAFLFWSAALGAAGLVVALLVRYPSALRTPAQAGATATNDGRSTAPS